MKKLLYLVVASVVALVAGLAGCADDLPEMKQTEQDPTSTVGKSALDMALERADEFFAQIGATTRTPRRIATVNTIAGATTRCESDTLLFLVNYADNQGFALLGADPSINDIYAISPTGSLTYEDIDANPVLADFLYDVVSYVIKPPVTDSITGIAWKYCRYKNIAVGGPWVSAVASDWHQTSPYNFFCKDSNGQVVNAGCVSVALGKLLSFYEKPEGLDYNWPYASITKFDFNWDAMLYSDNLNERYTVTDHMFPFLGNEKLLKTNYDEGSWSNMDSISPTIRTLGGGACIFQGLSMSGNIDTIASFIINGRRILDRFQQVVYKPAPLITFGKYKPDKYKNHAWVIDGVVTRMRCVTDSLGRPIGNTELDGSPKYSKTLPMWHCLWGDANKTYNGWYVYLKDSQQLDTVQYDPFSMDVNMSGVWPTGVTMPIRYDEWKVYGGCFPEALKISWTFN